MSHIQHQFWNEPDQEISKHMKFALIICNEIFGMLFESLENNEQLMVVNRIRQKFVKGHGLFIYRQKDPISFFKLFGVESTNTEQNMTNDGILIFSDSESRDKSVEILNNIFLKSNQKKIFYIELIDNNKIFYQLDIKEKINSDEIILFDKKSFKFFDLIECICERTGAHIQQGDIFYKGFTFPKNLYNHEIFNILSKYVNH